MSKPDTTATRKPLYGTQPRPEESTRPGEHQAVARHCVLCGDRRVDIWYELMAEGWVCDPCRPRATPIERDPHSENHTS